MYDLCVFRSRRAASFRPEVEREEEGVDTIDEAEGDEKNEDGPPVPALYKTTFLIKLGVGSPIKSPSTNRDKSPKAEVFFIQVFFFL